MVFSMPRILFRVVGINMGTGTGTGMGIGTGYGRWYICIGTGKYMGMVMGSNVGVLGMSVWVPL